MSFKDSWKEYLRTGEDQSFVERGLSSRWKQFLAEAEIETVQEPLPQEQQNVPALSPTEVPGELYHATRPPLLSQIAENGLRDFSDFTRHGSGQSGISFATDLDAVATGAFGNLILMFDGQELAASAEYEFRPHQDPSIATDEAEIRATMVDSSGNSGSGIDPKVDSLGTTIPFHFCKKLIFLYNLPDFEKKWLAEKFPHIEIEIYRQEKELNNEQ